MNSFGQTLINLCKSFNIHVLNGRTKGDSLGELTYISKTGCSQIGYSIVSSELFDLGVDFCVLSHDIELVDSDHLPTVSTFYCQKLTTKYTEDISVQSRARIIWKSDEQETFTTKLNNDQLCKTYLQEYKINLENILVNEAVNSLEKMVKQAAESMIQKTYTKKSNNKSVVWWDTNLENLKKC